MVEHLSQAGAATARAAAPRRAAVVATVADAAAAARLPVGVTGVEVRADLAGDLDPRELRRHGGGQLTYTLRSRGHGGHDADPAPLRHGRLRAAARGYDLVDLEADRDLVPEVLAGVPARKRRISWYGAAPDPEELRRRFDQMARVPAALYLLAPPAETFPAALAPLRLLAALRRSDVTAFATGPVAAFSRVVAPWLGAPVVFGSPAGPTAEQLVTDYPFPRLPRVDRLYGIVAQSLRTSLFLRLVNAGLQELAEPGLFVPFIAPDTTQLRESFWPAVAAGALDELGLPLRALTVAAPYKPDAFDCAVRADPQAQAARAANLLLRDDRAGTDPGRWQAATTDGSAVRSAVLATGPVVGAPVAVIGCGAAGRAAAFALTEAGAAVTLVNRGEGTGRAAAAQLGLPFVPLGGFRPGDFAAIVHATPVTEHVPFDLDAARPTAVVADFVCAAAPTALVAAARARGLTTVDGQQVLAQEVAHQFRMMTGRPFPGPAPDRRGE